MNKDIIIIIIILIIIIPHKISARYLDWAH